MNGLSLQQGKADHKGIMGRKTSFDSAAAI